MYTNVCRCLLSISETRAQVRRELRREREREILHVYKRERERRRKKILGRDRNGLEKADALPIRLIIVVEQVVCRRVLAQNHREDSARPLIHRASF